MRLVVVLWIGVTSLGIYAQPPLNIKLEEQLHSAFGIAAKNCGTVAVDDIPEPASLCAAEAFKRKAPFYVVYYVQGIDSAVGRALGENEEGDVFELYFNLDPSGGAHAPESIEVNACPSDVRLVMSRTARLRCENGHYRFDQGICPPMPRETPATSFAKEKGIVNADLLIHQDGTVSVLEIKNRDVSAEAAQLALRDISRWQFYPASKDGTSVQVRLPVQFISDGQQERVSFPAPPAATETKCLSSDILISRP